MSLLLSEFDFELPAQLIAQNPAPHRDAARLMRLDRATGAISHHRICELPTLLPPSVVVVNDTKVFPARLLGHRQTGGSVELLLLRRIDSASGNQTLQAQTWQAMVRASKSLHAGEIITVIAAYDNTEPLRVTMVSASEQGRAQVSFDAAVDLTRYGQIPLPPYINRTPTDEDRTRYQTVFAQHDGSVAAPTAGLHLTEALIDQCARQQIDFHKLTLHVGPGTFAPVRSEHIADHVMEPEFYELTDKTAAAITTAKQSGKPTIAVGTTVVRTLEATGGVAGTGQTNLFITPGFNFRVVDGLLTNFHLPKSTLLMLVCAFAGRDQVLAAYRQAVAESYRFYSYGDAMLIL